jgi:hypothetical protein
MMEFVKMTKDEIREAYLVDVLCYLESRADNPPRPGDWDGFAEHGVPRRAERIFEGARLSPPVRRATSYILKQLVDDGLLVVESWGIGGYGTHLQPTKKLLSQAAELSCGNADLGKIARGLELTDWGGDLVDVARQIADQA